MDRWLLRSVCAGLVLIACGCFKTIVIDDPELGPRQPRPSVTLAIEVPETDLEEVLGNLVRCTAQTFGPFHEVPGDSSSPTFTIECHVTETYRSGIDVDCVTRPNISRCALRALYNERLPSTCTTPSGRMIWFQIGP